MSMDPALEEYIELCRASGEHAVFACERCHRRFPWLCRDGLCRRCHRLVLAENMVSGGTVKTLRDAEPPISVRGMSEYCGNGHKWTPKTTRWRYRDRGGRHGRGWERDCLLCKQKSDGRAHMGKNVKGRNVTITIGRNGTHWNSGAPGGKDYS